MGNTIRCKEAVKKRKKMGSTRKSAPISAKESYNGKSERKTNIAVSLWQATRGVSVFLFHVIGVDEEEEIRIINIF